MPVYPFKTSEIEVPLQIVSAHCEHLLLALGLFPLPGGVRSSSSRSSSMWILAIMCSAAASLRLHARCSRALRQTRWRRCSPIQRVPAHGTRSMLCVPVAA
jgi:hypothetical protein